MSRHDTAGNGVSKLASLVFDPWRNQSERGATAVEYVIMVALIALVIIATVAVLGLTVLGLFEPVAGPLST